MLGKASNNLGWEETILVLPKIDLSIDRNISQAIWKLHLNSASQM